MQNKKVIIDVAAQEILRVLKGEKPFNIVNPEIYLSG